MRQEVIKPLAHLFFTVDHSFLNVLRFNQFTTFCMFYVIMSYVISNNTLYTYHKDEKMSGMIRKFEDKCGGNLNDEV